MLSFYFSRLLRRWGALLLLLLGHLGARAQASEGLVPDTTELRVLRQFYYATGGPSWTDHTNWPTSSTAWASTSLPQAATWLGVTLAQGDVYGLSFVGNNLTGFLPASLGELRSLRQLDCYYNYLQGAIPATLGQLTELRRLQLGINQLSGTIPPDLGQLVHLEYLGLFYNRLHGKLPPEVGNLHSLLELHLSDNTLSDSLPSSLGQLSQLVSLHLHANTFTGPIPSSLGRLSALSSLSLRYNRLSGAIPASLGQLSHLTFLNLSDNQLSGSIPRELGQLTRLNYLGVENNYLTGELPATFGQLGTLGELYLSRNQLTGPIPEAWGNLGALQWLGLDHNALSGPLPQSFGRLVNLRSLWAVANRLSGPIPASWGRMRALEQLSLAANQLSGPLPDSLTQLPQLRSLGLDSNRLTGPLPGNFNQLQALQSLDISNNQLTGPLPDLSGLHQLAWLSLQNNRLTGTLPAGWASLRTLRYLDLSRNSLRGPLPGAWRAFPQLTELRLRANRLSGPLPDALGIAYLDLAGNQLSGPVPTFYAQSPRTRYLNVAGNALTALPDFRAHPLGAQVVVEAQDNYLDFGSLEPNLASPGQALFTFSYAPQRTPGPADTVYFQHGEPLTATRLMSGQYNRYQWERRVGQFWTELPGQTSATAELGAGSEVTEGEYRVRVTNTWVPGITLYTKSVYLSQLPYVPLATNEPGGPSCPPLAQTPVPADRTDAQDPVNYVRTYVARTALTEPTDLLAGAKEQVQVTTQYLDGLGRPVQSVQRQASPTGRDLVQVQEYDALGRESKQFLPYSAAATPQGAYRPNARREQHTFYAGGSPDPQVATLTATLPKTGVAFAETGFEPSPLQRVLAQASPGESWSMASGHAVTADERPNTLADSVRRWLPGYGSEREDLIYQGYYAPGELWVKQSQDEQKQTAREFTDKEGRVVLKQVAQQGGNTPDQWLSTYYVHDDFGRLRAVVPPKAYQLIRRNQGQVTGAGVERLLFRYHYDAQGRVTEKQLPDQAGYQYTVYDALDRPILTQDVAQQTRQEWVVTKYDALGRVVYTALGRFPNLTGRAEQQRAELQRQADAATAPDQLLYEAPNASPVLTRAYYSDQAFPRLSSTSDAQLLTVNYYDSYDFDQNGQADASYQAPPAADLACAAGEVPQADGRVTGQLTRTLVRVLGQADGAPGAWLTTTSFFDDKLRPIQVVSTNARGGQDVVSTRFDFTGQALATHTRHQDPQQAQDLLVREQRRFDHGGRLLTLTQELAGATPQVIARHTYNELGQLEQKQLGGTLPPAAAGTAGAVPLPSDAGPAPLQRVDYRYNVRGWLTAINELAQPDPQDLWSFALSYDCGFQLPQYNGNIAGQRWRSAQDGIERAYGYRYDELSRLLQGDFVARAGQSPTASWSAERGNYRFWAASYDAGGNLLTLRRRGLVQPASRRFAAQYAETDNLRYRYQPPRESPDPQSNRLLRVDDLAPAATAFGAQVPARPDFTDGATSGATTPDYSYDAAGSLTSDQNKGIRLIRYNYLHLPERIEWSNGNALEYRYAASGQKVAKLAYEGSKPAVQTDYAGPWQYERDSLRWLTHAEGRALLQYRRDAAGQPRAQVAYEYTLKDHLGNLRVAFHPGERQTYTAMLDSDPDQLRREQQQFDSLSVSYPIRQVVGRQFAYGGDGVALLHAGGTQPRPLGPLKQLTVSRGDTVDVTAFGMYQQPVRNAQWSFVLASFVASLVQPPPAALPPGDGTTRKVRVLPLLSVGLGLVPAVRQLAQGVPTAYLRVLVYNQDSVVVAHHEVVLSAAARGGYERLYKRVFVPQAGYVQAYVANESEQEVYFDNVTVEHRQGLQVQENHYDPFGLDLVGLSRSPGLKELNQYSWNGKEKQAEFGLNWHDHGWRFYEPALGRWVVTDPDAEEAEQESWTTYQFGMDNAVRFNDLDGRQADEPGGNNLAARAYLYADGIAAGVVDGGYQLGEALHNTITSPIQTAKGLYGAVTEAVSDPKGTASAIVDNVKQSVGELTSGEPAALGRGLFNLASSTGLGGAGKAVGMRSAISTANKITKAADKLDDFNQARNKAVSWLEDRGFQAEKPNVGRLGATRGKATGMVGSSKKGGTAGFRIEHDQRSGAHINVFDGKEKGPHFQFDATEKTVHKIQRKYER